MWYRFGQFILKQRVFFISLLILITGVMAYFASHVKMSYEFTKAIPADNPKYAIYQAFVKKFGIDGTTMVVGF